VIDTYEPTGLSVAPPVVAGEHLTVRSRSLFVLRGLTT
jgi:hypothetical protein